MSIKEQQKQTGTVKWFKNAKGYGFATNEAGEDVFVHHNDIIGEGFKTLATGQKIQFIQTEGEKGLQATQIEVVETELERFEMPHYTLNCPMCQETAKIVLAADRNDTWIAEGCLMERSVVSGTIRKLAYTQSLTR